MARIPPPFAHPTRRWQIHRNVYHYTSLLNSTFAPTLAFSRLLIGFIPSDIFNQPRLLWADWQIGGVITTTKHAGWGQFYFFKKRHMHTRWHRHMCAQKHGCIQVLYGMIDMFDRHLLWSLWSALRSSVVCVLFTADIKFHDTWKEHHGIMSIIYQTLMTTLLEPSQITYHLNSTLNLIHLTSQNVNTLTDCCMLCLVHREISGLCMVVRDLHLNNYFCILYHSCDLLGGSIWCIFWYNLKI